MVIIWTRYRWPNLDVFDIHILMIGFFFGINTLIDIFLNKVRNIDLFLFFWVHFSIVIILSCTWLLIRFIPSMKQKIITIKNIYHESLRVSDNGLLLILLSIVLYTFYGYWRVGLVSYIDIETIEIYNILYPYWYKSAGMFIKPLLFCLSFASLSRIFNQKRNKRILWSCVFLITIALSFQYGRRSVFYILLISLVLYSYHINKNLFSFHFIKPWIILIVVMAIVSNLFQSYRSNLLRSALYESDIEIPTFSEALDAHNKTVSNLRIRSGTWRFNYIIFEKQDHDNCTIPFGKIINPNYS